MVDSQPMVDERLMTMQKILSSVSEHPRFPKSRKQLLRDRLYDLKRKYGRFMDKSLQFQPDPSWSWSACLRKKYRQGKEHNSCVTAGQGYKLKRRPEFITADQLQRNAAGVKKVLLKKIT